MGYYIETDSRHNKARDIIAKHGGVIVDKSTARAMMKQPGIGVIIVVDNGPFEAAAFAYDQAEFEAFTEPGDHRPKEFLLLDRTKAVALTGYTEEA